MLKKICGLFLGLVVCAGSACVTPTHASSAISEGGQLPAVVIAKIQASGEFGAKDEYIVLHNNSNAEVEITDWCIVNKTQVPFVCFTNGYDDILETFHLPAYGDAIVVSREYTNARSLLATAYTLAYDSTNQSSGNIVNSADILSVLDGSGDVVDSKEWNTAIPTGKLISRMVLLPAPVIYAQTNSPADWLFENRQNLPANSAIIRTKQNTGGAILTPDPSDTEPVNEPGMVDLLITEVLPNPAGSDTDKEFIELHNPNPEHTVSLENYVLRIGTSTVKTYAFPEFSSIPPLGYASFSNGLLGYSLNNTAGKVQLVKNGELIGESVEYSSPKDDTSWALINDVWQYTQYPTPGSANVATAVYESSKILANTTKPCAANQARNPETGRCRLAGGASSAPVPCKPNQERNPETNRCRNIAAATAPTPCKAGQERSLETNRCKTIVKMSSVGHGVAVQSKSDPALSWYYWVAIAAIVVLIVGYAVWEWRQELLSMWARLRTSFAKRSD